MFGKRCEKCGEARWSLLFRDQHTTRCPNCGTVMIDERRRPGAGAAASARVPVERRDAPPTVSG